MNHYPCDLPVPHFGDLSFNCGWSPRRQHIVFDVHQMGFFEVLPSEDLPHWWYNVWLPHGQNCENDLEVWLRDLLPSTTFNRLDRRLSMSDADKVKLLMMAG